MAGKFLGPASRSHISHECDEQADQHHYAWGKFHQKRHVVHRMHKMLVEGKTAVPELCPSLSADKLVMADEADRKSAVQGKSVSASVDLGVQRIIKKKKYTCTKHRAYRL